MENPFAPLVLIEELGPVRLVTLNRPEALNAANPDLHRAVARVWNHLAEDPAARAVVLTGAGRAFSAGGDIELLKALADDHASRERLLDEAAEIINQMARFPLPVVAAVNGPAVGLGANLALLSDVVFLAESAYLCDPHVSVGLTAADGGAPFWPLLTGLLRAKEYLFTGDRIPPAKAVEMGLASRVVPDADVLDEAVAFARRLAEQPPQAIQSTKRALNLHLIRAVAGVLDYALAQEFRSFETPEHRAVVAKILGR
jgi:enoyl-CoA hydratase